jgi:hypothetical protein
MKRLNSKKRIGVLVAVLAVGIAASVAAYAYFTASGSGTATSSIGSAGSISLSGSVTGTLYPAGAAGSVSVLATNSGSGSQYVNSIHLASVQIDHSSSTYTGATSGQQTTWDACDVSTSGGTPAFTMADISVATTLTKNGTGGDHVTKSGSLQMNDTGVSQNNCQGAPLQLNFTSS